MKLKHYLFLFLALSLLSCKVYKLDDDACEECGNYYFRYIDKTSVSFCGWTRDAINKLGGDMYVPEKIYNLNVAEIRIATKVKDGRYNFSSSYDYKEIKDYMKGVKSIVIPKTVRTIQSNIFANCSDIERITFKETSNWYAKDGVTHSWIPVDVSNPSNNVLIIKNAGSLKNIP